MTQPKHRTIYISGPMTGLPNFNYPAFNRAARFFRAMGHKVYNPAEFPARVGEEFPIREAFAEFMMFICLQADMVALLPGWEKSDGAVAEMAVARRLGIETFIIEDDE